MRLEASILQQKADEDFARRLQAEESSMQSPNLRQELKLLNYSFDLNVNRD